MDKWGNEYRFSELDDKNYDYDSVPLDLAVFMCIFIQTEGQIVNHYFGMSVYYISSSILKILNQTKLIKPKYNLIDIYLWHELNNEYSNEYKTGAKSTIKVIEELEALSMTTRDILDIRLVARADYNEMLHGLFKCSLHLWKLINCKPEFHSIGLENLGNALFPELVSDAIDFLTDPRNRAALNAKVSHDVKKQAKEKAAASFEDEKKILLLQHSKTYTFTGSEFIDFAVSKKDLMSKDYINELINLGVIEKLLRLEFQFYKMNYPTLKYKPYKDFDSFMNRILSRSEYNQVMMSFIIDYDIVKNFNINISGKEKPSLKKITS